MILFGEGLKARLRGAMYSYEDLSAPSVQRVLREHGFKIEDTSQRWLQARIVSIGSSRGSSGSLVSAKGLVLTNSHTLWPYLAKLGADGKTYQRDGFTAIDYASEVKLPNLEVWVVDSTEDVTAQIAKVRVDNPEANAKALRKITLQLEGDSMRDTGMRSEVKFRYHGTTAHLYRYKRYTDVRLVWLPEFGVSFCEMHNFKHRAALDVSLLRVYNPDGTPAETPNLAIASQTLADGESVMAVGHPFQTSFEYPASGIAYLRWYGEFWVNYNQKQMAFFGEFAKRGTAEAELATPTYFRWSNHQQVIAGGLDEVTIANEQLRAAEDSEVADKLEPGIREEFIAALAELARFFEAFRLEYATWALLEYKLGFHSQFDLAKLTFDIVRFVREQSRLEHERLDGFSDANLASLREQILRRASTIKLDSLMKIELEATSLAVSLGLLREMLPNPTVQTLLQGDIQALTQRFLAETLITNPAELETLLDGGVTTLEQSVDPLIAFMRTVEPIARRASIKRNVMNGPKDKAYRAIIAARQVVRGVEYVYTESDSTPRLLPGIVRKPVLHNADGALPAQIMLPEVLTHYLAHVGTDEPLKLNDAWFAVELADVPVNLAADNYSIGGVSGSPVLNTALDVVSVAFDGDTAGKKVMAGINASSLSVAMAGVVWVLRHIYKAPEALLKELGV